MVDDEGITGTRPEVTVVMSVYNCEQSVDRAIDSVRAQSLTNWELICVNDGSTDGTAGKLDAHASADPRVKIITQSNKGIALARHQAYTAGQGRYFVSVDADDYVAEDFLESLVADARLSDADAVTCDLLFQQGQTDRFESFHESQGRTPGQSLSGREAFNLTFPWRIHGLCLWRAEIIKTIGVDRTNAFNDFNADEYVTRALFLGCRKVYIGTAKYFYLNNPNSSTRKPSLRMLKTLDTNERLIALARRYDSAPDVVWRILRQQSEAHLSLTRLCLGPTSGFDADERALAMKTIWSSQSRLEADYRIEGRRMKKPFASVLRTIMQSRAHLLAEQHGRPLARAIRRRLRPAKSGQPTPAS